MRTILLLLFSHLTLNAYAQTSIVTLNPSKPEAGQQIIVTYEGKLAKTGTKMSCISHNSNLIYTETKVIPCQLTNNQLIGTFTLSDSVTYFIIKIENKKEIDNNEGKGFGFNIYKNGLPAKGTFLTEGYFLYLNKGLFNGKVEPEKAVSLIEKEYELNPELKDKTFVYYVQTLARAPGRKSEAINLAKIKLDEILNTGIHERASLRYAYLIAGDNNKSADSLKTLIAEKYPSGIAAFYKSFEGLQRNSLTKPDTAIEIHRSIVNKFSNLGIIPRRLMAIELIQAYAFKNDSINFEKSLNQYINNDKYQDVLGFIGFQLNDIAWLMLNRKKNLTLSKFVSEKSIEAYLKYDSLSTYYGNALDTYAAILFESGNKEKALANQRKAVTLMNYSNVSKNQKLLEYLIANNHIEEARLKAKEFIEDNVYNSKIDSLYKVVSFSSTIKDSDPIMATKSEADFTQNLKNSLINIAAPDFELKDLNGNTVKLSDNRGSVVVLDFWATWCGPCIRAFPAMQKTMNELKGQPVKFFYIDTYEDSKLVLAQNDDLSKKIKKIISDRKVNEFHVLLDRLKNNYFEATENYNVSSIPAKYVIDKEGRIRYKSTGFSSDEALIKELTSVIKMINN